MTKKRENHGSLPGGSTGNEMGCFDFQKTKDFTGQKGRRPIGSLKLLKKALKIR